MEVDAAYDDSNRAFLQAFLARGTLTLAQACPILAAIFSIHEGKEVDPNEITEQDLTSLIHGANSAISPLDLAIRSTLSQHDRTRIYVLVNTTSDELTQLATTHSADEISYIKRVLDEMFESSREICAVQGIKAIKLNKSTAAAGHPPHTNGNTPAGVGGVGGQGLTMMQAENLLGKLVEEGWLERSKAGFYGLAPRALVELKHYLLETYNDEDEGGDVGKRIKNCVACKEIVTVGQRCADRGCPVRLHDGCTTGFFRTQGGERKCSGCGRAWSGADFVGERVVTMSEAWLKGRRRSGIVSGGGRASRGSRVSDGQGDVA